MEPVSAGKRNKVKQEPQKYDADFKAQEAWVLFILC